LQQAHVQNIVRHRLFDDHLVLGVDRDLDIVVDVDLCMRRHGTAVGIGERHLDFAALYQRGKIRRIFVALFLQRLDLFRQVLDPRTAARALLSVARVEPFQIILQLLVGGLDELSQRSRREGPVFIVDRLTGRRAPRRKKTPSLLPSADEI
jgi:hypothetical protein